ncbi:MAG: hypothetical protein JZU67_00075, partial [Burkholderiaceae bacterium]|nr:hypothetical protein [Burkholderiaceae bacterium]
NKQGPSEPLVKERSFVSLDPAKKISSAHQVDGFPARDLIMGETPHPFNLFHTRTWQIAEITLIFGCDCPGFVTDFPGKG